jgi:NACHT domain
VADPVRLGFRRSLWRLRGPFDRVLFRSRFGPRGSSSVGRLPAWRGSRPQFRAMRFATFTGAFIFAAWFGRALYVVISRNPNSQPFDIDKACQSTTFSCGVVSGTLGFILTLGLAYLLFLFRLARVQTPYMRQARKTPAEVVQTADRTIGAVVGRDALCHMLIANLRDPATRRPQVVVGGLGAGKTTLLVQLTKLLAERGAVPVPINLRDAQDNLDFRTLALHRFLRATNGAVTDDANAVRIWRQLCDEDKVVVLADGLEETLIEAGVRMGRDYSIRLAILQAAEQGLPLIITSRAHSPLRQMQASIIQLEPLSEEAILEYLQQDRSEAGRRLAWIVETADLAETPVYLQITRQLDQRSRLDYLVSRDGGRLDVRRIDRAELRLRLLDTWIGALIDGHFAAEVPLASDERAAIVEQLSVLACIGLQRDTLQVTFDDFEKLFRRWHPLIAEAGRKLADLGSRFDIQWAAIRGTQLGLVEARGDGVLFQRPLLQAYLGSRLIGAAMEDPKYRTRAMRWPGREFLMALVMHSRARVQGPRPTESAGSATPAEPSRARDWRLQDLLVEATMGAYGAKVLDLYAAALQIDCVDQTPVHNRIAELVTRQWPEVHALEPRSLEEAKLNLVHRFGDAMRTIAERYPQGKQDSSAKRRNRERSNDTVRPAYRQLYRISYLESSDPIRVAGAQEIGAGGDEAFHILEGVLGPSDDADSPDGRTAPHAPEEPSRKTGARPRSNNGTQEDHARRELILRAWLAPLLAGSADETRRDARDNLQRWLQFVGGPASAQANYDLDLRLYLEVALAQGFKYAANRRWSHPHARMEIRSYLAEQATEMLRSSRFWFSQLTLLHALCLWELPDDGPWELPDDARPKQSRRRRTDPGTVVLRWADMLGKPQHPFVLEALRLVTWTLDTGLPERFIWIDEKDVAARIGSYPAHLRSAQKRNMWIPPSTGWTVLHPRAQKLLADVLLLLNLAERGQQPNDYYRSRRLQRINRNDLPPCLTRNRDPLDPGRSGGLYTEPGSNCMAGCIFGLCPYPPKREASFRTELSESFCLRQKSLMKSRLPPRLTSSWQEIPPAHLRQFWEQMARRARG